jgi:hypothetical protein
MQYVSRYSKVRVPVFLKRQQVVSESAMKDTGQRINIQPITPTEDPLIQTVAREKTDQLVNIAIERCFEKKGH